MLKRLNPKGQLAGVGSALIGIVMTIIIVTMLITVGTSVNVQVYDNVTDDINGLDANIWDGVSPIQSDANLAIESGFEAIAETGDNLNIVVVGVMAAIVISVVMGALAGVAYNRRGGGMAL